VVYWLPRLFFFFFFFFFLGRWLVWVPQVMSSRGEISSKKTKKNRMW
jgi:hypothetical protein